MKFNLTSLLLAVEASTPDGRWSLLQKWLKENPSYEGLVDRWSRLALDQVFIEIRDLVTKKNEVYEMFFNKLITSEMETRIKSAIKILQACYRERNNQTVKEITHGSSKPARKSRKRASKSIH